MVECGVKVESRRFVSIVSAISPNQTINFSVCPFCYQMFFFLPNLPSDYIKRCSCGAIFGALGYSSKVTVPGDK